MTEVVSHRTRLIVASVCLPLLVYIAYRPFIENPWFIDSLSQFDLSPITIALLKLPRLFLFVGLGAMIPLHHWISSQRVSFSSIAGALLFALFPFLDHFIHFSYGVAIITCSIILWSGLALSRILFKPQTKWLNPFWTVICLVFPFVFNFNFINFASLNACLALFLHFQAFFDIEEGSQRNYMVLFFLIMFEMISLQIRQTWLGSSTNWTGHLMNYKIGDSIFRQTVSIRDISELSKLPDQFIIPGGERADLIKSAHDFMKPESRLVLREKLEYFIAVAHLHLDTIKDRKKEKWFWYFLEKVFYTRSLKLGYDEYSRLFVMFHSPFIRIWKDDKDFEFFHLKYEEKINELVKNENIEADKKFLEFLKSEQDYLRGF